MKQSESKLKNPVSLKEQANEIVEDVKDTVSVVEKSVDILSSDDASLKEKLDAVKNSAESVGDTVSSALNVSVAVAVLGKESVAAVTDVVVAAEVAVVEVAEAVEAVDTAVDEVKEALENPKDIGEVLEAVAAVSVAAVETFQAAKSSLSLIVKLKKLFSCCSCCSANIQHQVVSPAPQCI